MPTFRPATTSDLDILFALAKLSWQATYPGIISQEQIDYMLERMYGAETIRTELETGKSDWLIGLLAEQELQAGLELAELLGYASYGPHPVDADVYRLHKLYLNPGYKGQGYGKLLLAEVVSRLPANCQYLELNVNKKNPAVAFYEKSGFMVYRQEVLDIGQGFVMDDYVMRLKLH